MRCFYLYLPSVAKQITYSAELLAGEMWLFDLQNGNI